MKTTDGFVDECEEDYDEYFENYEDTRVVDDTDCWLNTAFEMPLDDGVLTVAISSDGLLRPVKSWLGDSGDLPSMDLMVPFTNVALTLTMFAMSFRQMMTADASNSVGFLTMPFAHNYLCYPNKCARMLTCRQSRYLHVVKIYDILYLPPSSYGTVVSRKTK